MLRHQQTEMQDVGRNRVAIADNDGGPEMSNSVELLRKGAGQPRAPVRGRISWQVAGV
jgi:hypothetical protein